MQYVFFLINSKVADLLEVFELLKPYSLQSNSSLYMAYGQFPLLQLARLCTQNA